jgi:hypothetical protein
MFRLYNIHPVKAKSNSDVILLLNISGIGNEIVIYKTKVTNKRKKEQYTLFLIMLMS